MDFGGYLFDVHRTYRAYNTSSEVGIGLRSQFSEEIVYLGRYSDHAYLALTGGGNVTYFRFYPNGDLGIKGNVIKINQ